MKFPEHLRALGPRPAPATSIPFALGFIAFQILHPPSLTVFRAAVVTSELIAYVVLVFLHESYVLSRGDHGACVKAPSVPAHADRLRPKSPPKTTRDLFGADPDVYPAFYNPLLEENFRAYINGFSKNVDDITTDAPNVRWTTDSAKVWTADEGWLWVFTTLEHSRVVRFVRSRTFSGNTPKNVGKTYVLKQAIELRENSMHLYYVVYDADGKYYT